MSLFATTQPTCLFAGFHSTHRHPGYVHKEKSHVPTPVCVHLLQVGNAERTVKRIHTHLLQNPGAALEIGQYPGVLRWINKQPTPTGFPTWRRFLWLFAFASSVTRVTWQAFRWSAASAAERRSLKQPRAGLEHMVKPLWGTGLADKRQSSVGWHGWVLLVAPFVLAIVAAVLVVVLS
jgi:hypothetical protein